MTTRTELTPALEELRRCAVMLVGVCNELLKEKDEEPQAPESEEKQITLAEVRALLAEKSRQGYTAGVRAIITARGAERLSDIDPAEYAAVMKEAEALDNG